MRPCASRGTAARSSASPSSAGAAKWHVRARRSQCGVVAFPTHSHPAVAAASLDGTARVWDCPSAACLLSLPASDAGPVHDVCARASSGGHVLATAGEDGSVRLWDVRVPGSSAAVAASGAAATGSAEASATPRPPPDQHNPSAAAANACAFAGDGDLLVAGFHSGAVRVWDTRQASRCVVQRAGGWGGASSPSDAAPAPHAVPRAPRLGSAPLCEAQVSDAPVHRLERGHCAARVASPPLPCWIGCDGGH